MFSLNVLEKRVIKWVIICMPLYRLLIIFDLSIYSIYYLKFYHFPMLSLHPKSPLEWKNNVKYLKYEKCPYFIVINKFPAE